MNNRRQSPQESCRYERRAIPYGYDRQHPGAGTCRAVSVGGFAFEFVLAAAVLALVVAGGRLSLGRGFLSR
jgi:hypothetical protein